MKKKISKNACVRLVLSDLIRTFAMTKRREKAKAQATQLSKQLAIQVKKEKDESLVESGKYYLDLSKLIQLLSVNQPLPLR